MKRTEMLNLMAWRIRDIRKYDCNEMDVAVELLDEMEKAGMLPPHRPSDEKVIRCQVSEWEPE
jgi:hypothetical protein